MNHKETEKQANAEIKRLDRTLIAHGAILDYYQDTMQITRAPRRWWQSRGMESF